MKDWGGYLMVINQCLSGASPFTNSHYYFGQAPLYMSLSPNKPFHILNVYSSDCCDFMHEI